MIRLIRWAAAVLGRILARYDGAPAVASKGQAPEGAGRPPGRPKKPVARDVTKAIRWTSGEWALVSTIAERRGLAVSAYIRQVVAAHAAGEYCDEVGEGAE